MASGRACPVARRAAPADDCAPAAGLRPGDQGRGQRGDGERLRPARLHPCRGRRVAGARSPTASSSSATRRPIDVNVDKLAANAPGYVSAARRDPDGKGHPHRARTQGHGELDGRRRAAVRRSAARTPGPACRRGCRVRSSTTWRGVRARPTASCASSACSPARPRCCRSGCGSPASPPSCATSSICPS